MNTILKFSREIDYYILDFMFITLNNTPNFLNLVRIFIVISLVIIQI
jgi:hypothetical protein